MLFAGRSDTITVEKNFIKNTSGGFQLMGFLATLRSDNELIGRGPHIGYDGGYQYLHLVNSKPVLPWNYW
jgi:hypothetical protein